MSSPQLLWLALGVVVVACVALLVSLRYDLIEGSDYTVFPSIGWGRIFGPSAAIATVYLAFRPSRALYLLTFERFFERRGVMFLRFDPDRASRYERPHGIDDEKRGERAALDEDALDQQRAARRQVRRELARQGREAA